MHASCTCKTSLQSGHWTQDGSLFRANVMSSKQIGHAWIVSSAFGRISLRVRNTLCGPFPYAVGMMHGLSRFLVSWLVDQPHLHEFESVAKQRTRPPMLDHGEDTLIGMYMYLSPWPFTAKHWGWAKLHDLCFECRVKTSLWRPVTAESVVAHHVANPIILRQVRTNMSLHAMDTTLAFEVNNLDELCAKPNVAKSYEKCRMFDEGDDHTIDE